MSERTPKLDANEMGRMMDLADELSKSGKLHDGLVLRRLIDEALSASPDPTPQSQQGAPNSAQLNFVQTGKMVARFIEAPSGSDDAWKDRRSIQLWCNAVEDAALRLLDEHNGETAGFVLCTREYFDELRGSGGANRAQGGDAGDSDTAPHISREDADWMLKFANTHEATCDDGDLLRLREIALAGQTFESFRAARSSSRSPK